MLALVMLLSCAPQADDARTVTQLVEALGSAEPAGRDEAVRRLKEEGARTIPLLETASRGSDPEAASRAAMLLRWFHAREVIGPKLREKCPTILDDLAAGGDAAWVRAFFEAVHNNLEALHAEPLGNVEAPRSFRARQYAGSKPWSEPDAGLDVSPLVGPAVRGASGAEELLSVLQHVLALDLRAALPFVQERLKDSDPTVRAISLDALLRLAACKRYLCVGETDTGKIMWREYVYGATDTPEDIFSAAPALRDALPAVAALLEDKDARVRWFAVNSLVRLRAGHLSARLGRRLRDDDPQVRELCAYALAALGAADWVDDVLALRNDPVLDVRRAAVEALGELAQANPGARDAILARWRRPELVLETPDLQAAALKTLVRLGAVERARGHERSLLDLLRDGDQEISRLAGEALHALDARDRIAEITFLLRRSLRSIDEQHNAANLAYVLSLFGAAETTGLIVVLLQSEQPDRRETAAKALGRLGNREIVPAVQSLLQSDEAHARAGGALALGHLKPEGVAASLLPLLCDDDINVRATAAWAIGEVGDSGCIDALLERLVRDDAEAVRSAALRAVARLSSAPAASSDVPTRVGASLLRFGIQMAQEAKCESPDHRSLRYDPVARRWIPRP